MKSLGFYLEVFVPAAAIGSVICVFVLAFHAANLRQRIEKLEATLCDCRRPSRPDSAAGDRRIGVAKAGGGAAVIHATFNCRCDICEKRRIRKLLGERTVERLRRFTETLEAGVPIGCTRVIRHETADGPMHMREYGVL